MSAGEGLLWTRRWDLLRKLSDSADRLCDGKTASFAKVGFQLYWTAWQPGESSLLDCAELICRTLSGAGLAARTLDNVYKVN